MDTDLCPAPLAWLYPYYADLRRDPAFARLASEHQAAALADAVAPDYQTRAAEIREWTGATLRTMLTALDMATASRPAPRVVDRLQRRGPFRTYGEIIAAAEQCGRGCSDSADRDRHHSLLSDPGPRSTLSTALVR
jgi:hypothetical protein